VAASIRVLNSAIVMLALASSSELMTISQSTTLNSARAPSLTFPGTTGTS
jgi:hypothetical protein